MIDFSVMIFIVMGVAQLWKKLGLDVNLIPVLNVLVAMILSSIWLNDLALLYRLQQGLIIGLSASGVYDVGMGFKKKYK